MASQPGSFCVPHPSLHVANSRSVRLLLARSPPLTSISGRNVHDSVLHDLCVTHIGHSDVLVLLPCSPSEPTTIGFLMLLHAGWVVLPLLDIVVGRPDTRTGV